MDRPAQRDSGGPAPAQEEKLYRDVAIPPLEEGAEGLQRCLRMRELRYAPGLGGSSKAVAFYLQAKFMEDFQDSFDEAVAFSCLSPTYQDMNYRQLRSYFSWRTRCRRGDRGPVQLSFLFVHLYELLNGIGLSGPQGFQRILELWQTYRSQEPLLDRYLPLWLRDYAVYYDLDREILQPLGADDFDSAALVLWDWQNRSDGELFEALKVLSSYDVASSRFYKAQGQAFRTLAARIYRRLAQFWQDRQEVFCEHLLGPLSWSPYEMFRGAPFCHRQGREDFIYEVNSVHRYRCQGRRWSRQGFPWAKTGLPLRALVSAKTRPALGALLKALDARMRHHWRFGSPLKDLYITQAQKALMDQEILAFLRPEHQRARESLDLSQLEGIRSDALAIQRRLTEGEFQDDPPAPPSTPSRALPEDRGGKAPALTPLELEFLRCLLEGRPWQKLLREQGVPWSMAMDSINEKLLDLLGDTALVEGPQGPELLEDYSADVKGLVESWNR